jgi:hypothetical protein
MKVPLTRAISYSSNIKITQNQKDHREAVFLLQVQASKTRSYSTAGSLKFTHHFGLNCFATFGEQLILQDSVTQSISSPRLTFALGGAAALAAGDKCCGTLCGPGPIRGSLWSVEASGWIGFS